MATTRINFPEGAYPGESFVYDVDSPTLHTEHLSFYLLSILDLITSEGGTIEIELETQETQETAYDTWHTDFRTWLDSAQESVAAYLTEPEGSRAAFLIPLAPALPAVVSGAIMLSKGLAIKMAIDVGLDVVRSVQKFQAETRLAHQSRMFDKAFFDDGWFSSPVSKIDRLIDVITQSGLARDSIGGEKSFVEELVDALGKENMLKILSHVVVNSHGNIEGVDFGIAEDFGL
jgi:hypothetical protein